MTGWDPARYDRFGYVPGFGRDVLDLLDPRPGELVADVGCGTGELTAQIAARGAQVVGADADAAMVSAARTRFPGLSVVHADATSNGFVRAIGNASGQPLDAVFSNAALHWMPDQPAVLGNIAAVLRPGGRFVAEMGARGNVAAVLAALEAARAELGLGPVRSPWWFPSLAGQAALLEQAGFEVTAAWQFPRPTPLADAARGIADWVQMFGPALIADVPADRVDDLLARVNRHAAGLRRDDGVYVADYRRLRFVAVRTL